MGVTGPPLVLYRALLKAVRPSLPAPVRRKMRANIRKVIYKRNDTYFADRLTGLWTVFTQVFEHRRTVSNEHSKEYLAEGFDDYQFVVFVHFRLNDFYLLGWRHLRTIEAIGKFDKSIVELFSRKI